MAGRPLVGHDFAEQRRDVAAHRIVTGEGRQYEGTWEDIVRGMRAASSAASRSLEEFMRTEARRGESITGMKISTRDAETFIRASADAGLLRILR